MPTDKYSCHLSSSKLHFVEKWDHYQKKKKTNQTQCGVVNPWSKLYISNTTAEPKALGSLWKREHKDL